MDNQRILTDEDRALVAVAGSMTEEETEAILNDPTNGAIINLFEEARKAGFEIGLATMRIEDKLRLVVDSDMLKSFNFAIECGIAGLITILTREHLLVKDVMDKLNKS